MNENIILKYNGKDWVSNLDGNINIESSEKYIKFNGIKIQITGKPYPQDSFLLKINDIISHIKLNISSGKEISSTEKMTNIKKKDGNLNHLKTINCNNIQKFLRIRDEKFFGKCTLYELISEFYYYINMFDKNLTEIKNISKENLDNLYSERNFVTGIDFNDEYIKLEMCQQYYKVNIKLLKITNTMFESLLNIV